MREKEEPPLSLTLAIFQVLWRLPQEVKLMESAESLDKNFKAEMLQDGPSDGMFTAKLVIQKVTEEIAKSDMKLEVTNALGTTFYPFKLSLGEKPAPGERETVTC